MSSSIVIFQTHVRSPSAFGHCGEGQQHEARLRPLSAGEDRAGENGAGENGAGENGAGENGAGENGYVLGAVIRYLTCPYCGDVMGGDDCSLRCGAGHTFDIARQGYVSLLPAGAKGGGGDTAAMVQARAGFLAAGHFASLAADLAQAAVDVVGSVDARGCVVDVGAGTGYYLAAVLDRLPERDGLALDISRSALRKAARAHRRIGAVGCDAWRKLPVTDSAAVLALNVFAPRQGAELHRVLHPAGRLLLVAPASDHLGELIGPLGLLTVGQRKEERLTEKLRPYFEIVRRREHRVTMSLDHRAIGSVVAMGPSSRHAETAVFAARIGRLPDPMPVTLAVTLFVFRPVAA